MTQSEELEDLRKELATYKNLVEKVYGSFDAILNREKEDLKSKAESAKIEALAAKIHKVDSPCGTYPELLNYAKNRYRNYAKVALEYAKELNND